MEMFLTSDFCTYRTNVTGKNYYQMIDEMMIEMQILNVKFLRMTEFPSAEIIFLEGWKIQPEDQGPEPEWEDVIGFGR